MLGRTLLGVAVLCGLAGCKPQAKAPPQLLPAPHSVSRGLVFHVTQGERQLFLTGSIHMLTEADYPLPPAYETAYQTAGSLVFEIPPSGFSPAAVQAALAEHGTLKSGKIQDMLTPKAQTALANWGTQHGQDVTRFQSMPPWRAATTIATLASQAAGLQSQLGLDLHLKSRAASDGKTCTGFESVDGQFRIFAGLSPATQSTMVEQATLEYSTAVADLAQLLNAWRSGDLAALYARTERSFSLCPEVQKALLDDRNAAWQPVLREMLSTPVVEMVVVGAAHLAGPKGLVALLQADGCVVKQL